MAKIADKHGLTNRYREAGHFGRNVKRGRPAAGLFGKVQPNKKAQKRKTVSYVPPQNTREPVPFTPKKAFVAIGVALGIFLLAALLIVWAAHKSGAM